jgi:acyl-CoA dehydrogenase
MGLVDTEEQASLRRSVRDFARTRAPVSELRALRDGNDPIGFSRDGYRAMTELGWPAIPIPERFGGAGLGYAELGIVLEELGRTLAAHPLLGSVVLGASAIALSGDTSLQAELLPAIAAGERIVALAHDEGPHHTRNVTTRARGQRLYGEKSFVLDGHVADLLLVSALTEHGTGLFLVRRDAPGLTVKRTTHIDARNAARVRLDGVESEMVSSDAAVLDRVLDRGAIALAAEMLGSALQAFEMTVEYLKVRKQFGVPIGSFQALKHRAAWMYCELELSRSIVADALQAIDDDRSDLSRVASAAKARLSRTFVHVANEAVQMHGGIGVTDEHDIGLYLKRARVAATCLGNESHHVARFARLSREGA